MFFDCALHWTGPERYDSPPPEICLRPNLPVLPGKFEYEFAVFDNLLYDIPCTIE